MNRAARIQKAALLVMDGKEATLITVAPDEIRAAVHLAAAWTDLGMKTLARKTLRKKRITESAKRSTYCQMPKDIAV